MDSLKTIFRGKNYFNGYINIKDRDSAEETHWRCEMRRVCTERMRTLRRTIQIRPISRIYQSKCFLGRCQKFGGSVPKISNVVQIGREFRKIWEDPSNFYFRTQNLGFPPDQISNFYLL